MRITTRSGVAAALVGVSLGLFGGIAPAEANTAMQRTHCTDNRGNVEDCGTITHWQYGTTGVQVTAVRVAPGGGDRCGAFDSPMTTSLRVRAYRLRDGAMVKSTYFGSVGCSVGKVFAAAVGRGGMRVIMTYNVNYRNAWLYPDESRKRIFDLKR